MDKYQSAEMIDWLMDNTKIIGERVEQYDLRKPFKLPYLPSQEDIKKADESYIITNKLAPIWNNFLVSKTILLVRISSKLVTVDELISKVSTFFSGCLTP